MKQLIWKQKNIKYLQFKKITQEMRNDKINIVRDYHNKNRKKMIIMFNYWSKSGQKDKNSLKIKKNALKSLQIQKRIIQPKKMLSLKSN